LSQARVTTFHTEAIGRLFVGGNKENTRKRTSSFVGLLIRILVTLGLSQTTLTFIIKSTPCFQPDAFY